MEAKSKVYGKLLLILIASGVLLTDALKPQDWASAASSSTSSSDSRGEELRELDEHAKEFKENLREDDSQTRRSAEEIREDKQDRAEELGELNEEARELGVND
jgi:hypothetical protein